MRRNRIRSVRDLSPNPSPVQNRTHRLPCEPHHVLSSSPLRPETGTFAANYAQWTGGVTCDARVVAPRPGALEGSVFVGWSPLRAPLAGRAGSNAGPPRRGPLNNSRGVSSRSCHAVSFWLGFINGGRKRTPEGDE